MDSNTVKRFYVTTEPGYEGRDDGIMELSENGEYVTYEDYAALSASHAQLKAALQGMVDKCVCEGTGELRVQVRAEEVVDSFDYEMRDCELCKQARAALQGLEGREG